MQVLGVDKPDLTSDISAISEEAAMDDDGFADAHHDHGALELPRFELPGLQLPGEVAFASREARAQRTADLLDSGAVVVNVPPLPRAARGQLAEYIGERIERELAARGAPSPYLAAWSSMPDEGEALLADQVARARAVGATGIAILLGSLADAAKPTLSPEDSATLRLFARTAACAPLVLLVDDGDLGAYGYAKPVRLDVLLAQSVVAETAEAHLESDKPNESAPDGSAHVEPAPNEPAASGPSNFWRAWTLALGAAQGPQPLAALERLFADSYVPLANAIAAGLDDPRALRAHDEFRHGFERTYSDAFATFAVTGRRPRLVMDAYEIAAKQARLHNARAAHVAIVDSMRFDLGGMVRDALARRAAETSALLASEMLLWSALPTTTFRQLETLARGMEALRLPSVDDGSEVRVRVTPAVRRLRVGSRELHRLSVIPAMLANLTNVARSTPAQVTMAFDDIAETVTGALVRHIQSFAPRTLLLIMGDHGFSIDRRGRITDGGASPEEVLVPAYTYLVGNLQ